jgi:nitrogen regulatory protein PII
MKYLIAIIEQERLGEVVRDIRSKLSGKEPKRLTVSDVACYGLQDLLPPVYRGHTQAETPMPKVKLEMVVEEGEVQAVIDTIAPDAHASQAGDEGIIVLEFD